MDLHQSAMASSASSASSTTTTSARTRTPVLLLLDHMLSQDVRGIQAALRTMRHQLPGPVVTTYLPPEHVLLQASTTTTTTASSHSHAGGATPASRATTAFPTTTTTTMPIMDLSAVIIRHLSIYLQTFPQQAAIASHDDGSLPLHFAASLGEVALAHTVWQAVRKHSVVGVGVCAGVSVLCVSAFC